MRGAATILGQDYGRIREMSREARKDSGAAMEAVKDVEKRMGPLAQLHELQEHGRAPRVAQRRWPNTSRTRRKALESQKHTIDHAVVEANRLNELVWSMDSQIAKLNEGNKQIVKPKKISRGWKNSRPKRPASSTP